MVNWVESLHDADFLIFETHKELKRVKSKKKKKESHHPMYVTQTEEKNWKM